ncbi:MAG TPA: GntR family transcriptional regulator [Acidobacteriaceae bacterium]|nr:GntR family transcriptional regulator [Acidobacteriaceae bacterium]
MGKALVRVEEGSPVPAYRQIVDQIRVHLNSGVLKAGDKLPSVRTLSMQLGVHFNTIAEAYRRLANEGWIDLQHGCRAVVCMHQPAKAIATEEADLLCQRLRHLLAEMRLKGIPVVVVQREVGAVFER